MSYLVYESIPEDINQTLSSDREMGGIYSPGAQRVEKYSLSVGSARDRLGYVV